MSIKENAYCASGAENQCCPMGENKHECIDKEGCGVYFLPVARDDKTELDNLKSYVMLLEIIIREMYYSEYNILDNDKYSDVVYKIIAEDDYAS
jgi:hypothetical protein